MTSVQIKLQLIKSLINELDFETNPDIMIKLHTIRNEIYEYWTNYLNATYSTTTKTFTRHTPQ